LEIKYEEQHQPHVIIEKADSQKGDFVWYIPYTVSKKTAPFYCCKK